MLIQRYRGCQGNETARRAFAVGLVRESHQNLTASFSLKVRDYLTAALSSLPAENLGMRAAGIFNASPVRGLRPIRAFRFEMVNVPKFTNVTRCPFREVVTAPVKASSATVAATLVIPALVAIFAINSSLVIGSLPWWLATCRCVDVLAV